MFHPAYLTALLRKYIYPSASKCGQQTKKLKEQVEAVLRENTILKRAVAIQNDRQKDCEAGSQELLQLKQMVSKCQEQLRTLELDNYTLAMQLKRALHNSTIPCTFGRDAF